MSVRVDRPAAVAGPSPTTLERRDRWPVLVAVLGLLAWSIYAYLTVRVDADILAEALQVQRWLKDPFWVLSYPGQLYGGVLEYPVLMLSEAVSPANPYAVTFVRILYLPLIGLMTCINVRRLGTGWSLWPVALAATAGPAVLHGFMPIKDLYPFAWLLMMAGVTVLYWTAATSRPTWLLVLAGALVGLAAYQHPTTALVSAPLAVAGMIHFQVGVRSAVRLVIGIGIGLVPFALALVAQPDMVVAYRSPRADVPGLLPALGLSMDSDAFQRAVLPNAWGVQFTDMNVLALPGALQLLVNALLVAGMVACAVATIPVVRALRSGHALPPYAYLVTLWTSFLVVLMVLTAFIRPVFYYGAGVAILVWITLAALPSVLPRAPRIAVTAGVIALMAITSLGAVLSVKPLFPHSITFKHSEVTQVSDLAAGIERAGIPFVYGTYWEALPIAFASNGAVQPITSQTSRFPLPALGAGPVLVAATDGSTALPVDLDRWPGSVAALQRIDRACTPRPDVTSGLPQGLVAYECTPAALSATTSD